MSSNVFSDSINRFTYDWLVRYCELHPFDKNYAHVVDTEVSVSKYTTVSLLFAKLIIKHMPHIYPARFCVDNNDIENLAMPPCNKIVVIVGRIKLTNLVPGTITIYNNKRIYFNSLGIQVNNSSFHPKELTYLLKGCESAFFGESSLTQPISYSEIWPLLRYCKSVWLDIKNLIYDEQMNSVLAKTPVRLASSTRFMFPNFCFSESTVLPVVDYCLTIPDVYCHFTFNPGYLPSAFDRMVQIVEDRLKASGYTIDTNFAPSDCERTIGFWKISNSNNISFRYLDRY